jgi:hypothetical protein
MDITSLAHKNLDNLDGYISIRDGEYNFPDNLSLYLQLINKNEEIIGIYINQPIDDESIIITNRKIIVCISEKYTEIEYLNIKDCHIEPSKKSNRILIDSNDGHANSILIGGVKENKFLDIYGFLRFIKKVLINIRLENSVSLTA